MGDLFGPTVRNHDPYKKKSPPTKMPPEGSLLVERHLKSYIKLTYPNGEYVVMRWTGSGDRMFERRLTVDHGIPKDKLDAILSYVWNFRKAYVKVSVDTFGGPPQE